MSDSKDLSSVPFDDEEGDEEDRFEGASRLRELGFDPLEKMVKTFKRFEQEDEYWTTLREKPEDTILEHIPTGIKKRKVRYSSMAHTSALIGMGGIAKELLRYRYSRVPEKLDLRTSRKSPGVSILLYGESEDDDIIEGEIIDEN